MEWKGSYTSSHNHSTPPLLPAVKLKPKQLPIAVNQMEQDKPNQTANEREHTSPTHKELHSINSNKDHVSSSHLSAHNSEVSIKTEDDTASEHDLTVEQPPVAEATEDLVSLSPLSEEENDTTLLQQSSKLLPEHLTSGDPVEEVSEELEKSEDRYSDDTMFEEESTQSPISKYSMNIISDQGILKMYLYFNSVFNITRNILQYAM